MFRDILPAIKRYTEADFPYIMYINNNRYTHQQGYNRFLLFWLSLFTLLSSFSSKTANDDPQRAIFAQMVSIGAVLCK